MYRAVQYESMKYILPIVLVVAFGIVGGAYLYQQSQSSPTVSDVQETAPTSASQQPQQDPVVSETKDVPESSPQPGAPSMQTYTMADVALHASEQSCWTVVRSTVYDLTAWIAKHPGGERAILSMCGKDGTASFEGQHGGSTRPENTLAGFEIGILR